MHDNLVLVDVVDDIEQFVKCTVAAGSLEGHNLLHILVALRQPDQKKQCFVSDHVVGFVE